ncbi:MAG TPA: glycosyltransferase [Candidatus Paceibacterota bacterium]|nr:glycosyltransferase [Candidatus Paceibacterota bacterium]
MVKRQKKLVKKTKKVKRNLKNNSENKEVVIDLSIIIPAHDEEKRIGPTLEAYNKFFDGIEEIDKIIKHEKNGFNYEIIVVVNNSIDKTLEIVEKLSKKQKGKKIKVLNFVEGGKGFAIIEGFKEAIKHKSKLIGFVDADMATGPDAFYDLVRNINNNDGIIASRYIKGSVVNPKQSFQRVVSSRLFNFWIRVLLILPYRDTQCGAKLFKRESITKVIDKLIITKWAFDVDLLYCMKKSKLKIKEFPTVWSDKEYSTINFKKAGPMMALAVIRLRLLNSPFSNIVKLYDKLPEWTKIHHKLK